MIIGRVTGQFGKNRVRVQLRVPAPLRRHAAEGRHAGLPQPRRRLDRPRQQRGARPMSPEATSTAARGYFDVPFYLNQASWTMPATNKLLLEAGYTPFRYQPIFGFPPPDGITNLIPVTEQSNAINPATGLPLRARSPTTATARVEQWGPAVGKTDDCAGVGVVRHRRAQREGRLPGPPARPAGQGRWPTRRSSPTASTRACRTRSATTCRTSAAARITNINSVFVQDSWTHGG